MAMFIARAAWIINFKGGIFHCLYSTLIFFFIQLRVLTTFIIVG